MATSVKLDANLKRRIQHLAEIRHRSAHWIMSQAILDYVTREEAKESFKQEAIASWKAYQETGLHVKGAKAQEWLKSWGTKSKKDKPSCHN